MARRRASRRRCAVSPAEGWAKAAGLKAIVGAEVTIGAEAASSRGRKAGKTPPPRSLAVSQPAPWTLPVLVASTQGYRNLCRVITRAKLNAPKGESSLVLEDF